MNTKKIVQFNKRSNDDYIRVYSNDVSNWKSVLCVHTKKKEICRKDIECHLRKYFSNHMTLQQYCQMKDFIDRRTFEEILRK
jgi:hypothetical protein